LAVLEDLAEKRTFVPSIVAVVTVMPACSTP
jgi:hypothetical protein